MAENASGERAFSVVRDALTAADMIGTARLALCRRVRAVMPAPYGCGIVLTPLWHWDEIRDPGFYFGYV